MSTKVKSNTVMKENFPRTEEPTWKDNIEYLFKTKIDLDTTQQQAKTTRRPEPSWRDNIEYLFKTEIKPPKAPESRKEGATNVVWQNTSVNRAHREKMNGHTGVNLWFTGLSGSGKTTLANAVEEQLHQMGFRTFLLDGDNLRHGLCSDLDFSAESRSENIRRVAELVNLFLQNGVIILTTFISPFSADRQMVREIVPEGDFIEVYCNSSLEVCEKRDVKGLYKLARAGEIKNYTGISSPYEVPQNSDIVVDTGNQELKESVHTVLHKLKEMKVIDFKHKDHFVF